MDGNYLRALPPARTFFVAFLLTVFFAAALPPQQQHFAISTSMFCREYSPLSGGRSIPAQATRAADLCPRSRIQ
jgi:hypothetical protein